MGCYAALLPMARAGRPAVAPLQAATAPRAPTPLPPAQVTRASAGLGGAAEAGGRPAALGGGAEVAPREEPMDAAAVYAAGDADEERRRAMVLWSGKVRGARVGGGGEQSAEIEAALTFLAPGAYQVGCWVEAEDPPDGARDIVFAAEPLVVRVGDA